MEEKIETFQEQNQKLDKELEKAMTTLKYRIECYRKISSYAQINMLIKDKESTLSNLEKTRKKQKVQQLKKEKSVHNISVSNSQLQQELDQNEESVNTLHDSNDELSKLLHTTTETLGLVKYEYESVKNVLDSTIQTKKTEQQEFDSTYKPIKEETDEMEKKIEENKRIIANMKQDLEQKQIELDITKAKKKQMIEQLKRTIQDKISEITVNLTTSAYVQKLISQQEQHWVEREAMLEAYNYVADAHKKITDTVARKAIVLGELKTLSKDFPHTPQQSPSDQLNNIYNLVLNENKRIGKNVAELKEEKESLEKEIQQLKTKIPLIKN